MKENLIKDTKVPDPFVSVRLSQHFKLSEFLNLGKYPDNIPTVQVIANLTYGCHFLLEPARLEVGPILINSGFRCERVNQKVGGVKNSQHLMVRRLISVRKILPSSSDLTTSSAVTPSPISSSLARTGSIFPGTNSARRGTSSG